MQRRWQVQPDETGTISREALIGALIDGAVMLDIAGGVLNVVVGRAPTNLHGEMLMTGAVLQWQDRTDAKPQAEAPVSVTREAQPASRDHDAAEETAHLRTHTEAGPIRTEPPAAPAVDGSDGFDYSKLEDEDIEPAPELAR